ncbi:MAG: stage II sporulation protein R [Clostridia bacterium]|nr:stage II sporulation protein R [Clostridia bacterium]
MKKLCISFLLGIIILLMALLASCSACKTEYLRIHVRANSNRACDQEIKYQIKDIVVEHLTPYVKKATSKAQAMAAINEQIPAVNRLIDGFLAKNGYKYSAKVELKQEFFPTRVYDDLTLNSGVYDALIITLGEGVGDNWWCVVYPPLCFSGEKVEYRSVVLEFFKRIFN